MLTITSNNFIGCEFSNKLNEYSSVLKWKSLNLKETYLTDESLILFSDNFQKLPQLEYLAISCNWSDNFNFVFCDQTKKLNSLKEIDIKLINEDELIKLRDIFNVYPKLKLTYFPNTTVESSKSLESHSIINSSKIIFPAY